jgi:hypothetical protein
VSAADPLAGPVRALFADLAHAGEAGGAGVGRVLCGEAGREVDGVRVRFTLRVGNGVVLEARYRAYGCPYTLATCEWLARLLPGAATAALQGSSTGGTTGSTTASNTASTMAILGGPLDWARRLGVPPSRLGRLLTIEDALHNTLQGLPPGGAGCSTIGLPGEC